jgi:hypothetical protein
MLVTKCNLAGVLVLGVGLLSTGLGNPAPAAEDPKDRACARSWLINRVDQQLRVVRALRVLEHINTPEARQVLEAMAKRAADTRPTEEAKAALQRLGK